MKLLMIGLFFFLQGCQESEIKEVQKTTQIEAQEKLIFYTADDFPYQTRSGEGPSFEIMNELAKKLGMDEDQIKFLPWARSFKTVHSGTKNTAIFSMSRKPDRIPHFDWCCYLYEGVKNEVVTPHEEFDGYENKSGVVWRGDSSESLIDELIKGGENIKKRVVNSNDQIIRLLLAKKVHFSIARKPLILHECKKLKLDCSSLNFIDKELEPRKLIFLAFSKDTNKELRDKFVKAFKEFRASDRYLEILNKHGFKYDLPEEFQ